MKDTIYEIYELITSRSNQVSDRFVEAYNEIMDKIEDGEVTREDVEAYKKSSLEAAKYNGYTNIQYETINKVNELIELL